MPPQSRPPSLSRDDSSSSCGSPLLLPKQSTLTASAQLQLPPTTTTTTANGDTTTTRRMQQQHPEQLGIILDLDGTLITEQTTLCQDNHSFIRPGAIEFLQWCKARGHSLAIWTAAHHSWAHYVAWKLCCATTAHAETCDTTTSCSSTASPASVCCQGAHCRKTFDFCWSRDNLRVRRSIPVSAHLQGVGSCRWCNVYRNVCHDCECDTAGIFNCPCRSTKPLAKVWHAYRRSSNEKRGVTHERTTTTTRNATTSSNVFSLRERTIIIENTPQQCIHNYGNAVYVPTYWSRNAPQEVRDSMFERLKVLILQMEQSPDVRLVDRCRCCLDGPHACLEQSWWYTTNVNKNDDDDDALATICLPVTPSSCNTTAPADERAVVEDSMEQFRHIGV